MRPELDTNWTWCRANEFCGVTILQWKKGPQKVKQPPKSQEYKHRATSILTTNRAGKLLNYGASKGPT